MLTETHLRADDLSEIDRDALERAMQLARRDPLRAQQLDSKLADESWVEVAKFAASCVQGAVLHLKPWQSPPMRIDEHADADQPMRNFCDNDQPAIRLLRRMLAAGISRYEPDPLTALAAAKKRR